MRLRGGAGFTGCVGVAENDPETDHLGHEFVAVTLPGSNCITTFPLVHQVEPIEPGPLASYANQAAAIEHAVNEWLSLETDNALSHLI